MCICEYMSVLSSDTELELMLVCRYDYLCVYMYMCVYVNVYMSMCICTGVPSGYAELDLRWV